MQKNSFMKTAKKLGWEVLDNGTSISITTEIPDSRPFSMKAYCNDEDSVDIFKRPEIQNEIDEWCESEMLDWIVLKSMDNTKLTGISKSREIAGNATSILGKTLDLVDELKRVSVCKYCL